MSVGGWIFWGIVLFLAVLFIVGAIASEIDSGSKKSKEKLFKILDDHIKAGNEFDIEHIRTIVASINRESTGRLLVAQALEDYIVHILSGEERETSPYRRDLAKQISVLIDKEKEEKPFEALPEDERRLLRSLNDAIKNNDVDSQKYNLNELNSVLSIRYKTYQRANLLNKWSVPLAIIGLMFTLIFGIMSVTAEKVPDTGNVVNEKQK